MSIERFNDARAKDTRRQKRFLISFSTINCSISLAASSWSIILVGSLYLTLLIYALKKIVMATQRERGKRYLISFYVYLYSIRLEM